MADESGGIPLETKLHDVHLDEEKVLPIPYNHQLTTAHSVSEMEKEEVEKNEIECLGVVQKTPVDTDVIMMEPNLKDRGEGSAYHYHRVVTNTTVVKRARGRPRKDCQRPPKHHLGQSAASKVFPGRPRFRGRKFQHFIMNRPPTKVQDMHSVIDIYEDIDTDLKSSCDIPEKMLISSSSLPDNELKIEKFCALCNLSEKSLLGQGKLKHFNPSEGFNCFQVMKEKAKEKIPEPSSSETGNELKLFFKKQKLLNSSVEQIKINRSKSVQGSSIVTELIQELEVTGFKTVPESSDIFEETGGLYAHFNCAAWSDGVTKTFEKALSNVDKAVALAVFQKCSKCSRFGASVRCCVSDCTKIYHYPCAIVSGALQNANCFKIICSIHLEDAFSFGVICMACHESGDLSQLLLCTSCSNYYHGTCMEPRIIPSPDVRAGWQCLECKVCQNCREPDDSKMIICNTCDKGYHPFCVKPAISSIPKSGWKCLACRMCGDCGARTPGNGPSSRWHMNYTVCDSCYQQRNKGIACPLCGKAYRQFSQRKGMKHCTICQKYIHEDCDKRPRRNSVDYVCPTCSSSENKNTDVSVVEHHIKDNSIGSSRESFLSCNEESLSSDSDDALEGLPGKMSHRRTSSNELRHKKSSKPKFKDIPNFSIPNFMYSLATAASQKDYKMDDDDPTEDNKLILASATDEFVLCQDLCVMCGSFGKGEEGKLLACAQCGQCYHTYCVSVKVTTVVLKKGWRCLDCTVCEGCGQPHDEGRLLLCDECDISFHIYCLDPPLQEVPQGNWKCKWCVNCTKCGSKSPGVNCDWQVNYTLCGPCGSLTMCCLCHQHYEENDLVIQCNHCERWLHGMCDSIDTEDQAEKCAEYGYTCPLCRSPDELPPHMLPTPRTPTPEAEAIPEKHTSPIPKPKEPEPPPVKIKQPIQYFLDGVCLSESGMKYIKSLAPEQPKKIPRPRKIKQGITLADGSMKPYSFQSIDDTTTPSGEETKMDAATIEELAMKAYDFEEGKLVIDPSKEEGKKKRPRNLQKLGIGGFSVKPRGRITTGKEAGTTDAAEGPMQQSFEAIPEVPPVMAESSEAGGSDKPKRKRKPKKKTHLDESFPSYLRDAFFGKDLLMSCKKLAKSSDSHEVDVKPFSGDSMKGISEGSSDSKAHLRLNEDIKDYAQRVGAIKNKDATNANIVYKNMIKSEIESIKEEHLSSASGMDTLGYPGSSVMSKVPAAYSSAHSGPQGMGSSMHPTLLQNLHHPDSNSSWPDTEVDQSQMQKNILKWESDEHLGLLSTISPVLYANINLPHLKIEFPAWADRVKQIAKIWRSLPPEKRQPYLQRARENRAASRTQQRSNSTESDKSQKETRTPDVDQEKQWKQFQAMRQLQHQAQQRQLLEQRTQANAMKGQVERPIGSPAVADLDKNLKLFHSKSLSEIPQYPTSALGEDRGMAIGKDRQKVFEKRWSSSALDINTAQTVIQDNKVKMEMPSPGASPFLKDNLQPNTSIAGRNAISRAQTSIEAHLSISDKSPKLIKSNEPFQSSNTNVSLQSVGSIQSTQINNPVLVNKDDMVSNVNTASMPKEVASTPPATPRPQSSDSFFQIGTSPQSHQLLSVVDSHSQPNSVNKGISVPSSSVIQSHFGMPPKAPVAPSPNSPKQPHSLQQPFVLQQGSLTPANIAKQLSQYKETFGSISGTHVARNLLNQEKPIEQQNIERFLQEDSLTLPFTNKIPQHQQLRDLLQTKKFAEPGTDGSNLIGSQPASQKGLIVPGSMSNTSTPTTATMSPSDNSSFTGTQITDASTSSEKQSTVQQSPHSDMNKELLSSSQEGKRTTSDLDDLDLTAMLVEKDEPKEEVAADQNKKRKTTAGDLVKDLETEPEEHDVIAANCSLDVLSADVGELELDDDELLGLGSDFNILEYADPELDKSLVGEGDKNNILDEHLDLDDKDEELEEEVIKETDGRHEKHFGSPEMSQDKKETDIHIPKDKDPMEPEKDAELPENFLDFDKKDLEAEVGFESSFQSKDLDDNIPLEPIRGPVKEEPKQVFSSCSLSSQNYSPSVDIKLEKPETCQVSKQHQVPFGAEVQARLQVPDAMAPPPSYRMVTALKQTLATHQHPQPPVVQQNKGNIFPLHLNMNLRQELSLSQQNVLSSNVVDTNKPLLLQEQPLLLAELVEQEKREQRRQTQEGLISPHGDALLSDIDFERLKDDVFSGPPDDTLGGPGSLLGPHDSNLAAVSPSVGVPSSPSSHTFGPPPYSLLWQNQETQGGLASRPVNPGFIQSIKKVPPVSPVIGSLGAGLVQKAQALSTGSLTARPFNPNFVGTPPSPPVDPHMDPEKLKLLNYEKHLLQQQAVLTSQQKYFETEVIKLRKVKKALNAKQRQLRKNGSELTENDSLELARVSQEQAGLQKQLDQVRKQTRQNTLAIQDHRLKQQKRQQLLQQQQQPQPPQTVQRSPMHSSINSVQSSPQNSQSPHQFQHGAPPSPMMPSSPSTTVRLQSPSHLMQPSVSIPVSLAAGQGNLQFSQQMQQMAKSENANWQTPIKVAQGDLQGPDRFMKREQPFDRNVNPQTFSLNSSAQSSHPDIALKSLIDVKKNLGEETFKVGSSDVASSASIPGENVEQTGFGPKSETGPVQSILKEQKPDVTTAPSTVSQSILSQSLPSSVSNTLKFTLRQTGMPTGCLPTEPVSESPNELSYDVSTELSSKPRKCDTPILTDAKPETPKTDSGLDTQNAQKTPDANQKSAKSEAVLTSDTNQQVSDVKVESNSDKAPEVSTATTGDKLLTHIKQEIVDESPSESTSIIAVKQEVSSSLKQCTETQNEKQNDGFSDEELENINKTSLEAEQNVLLKQLLQNCPSADTPRKADDFIGLRNQAEDGKKLDLPFDVDKLTDNKDDPSKKQNYLIDMRRAQLDKEPTPPPGDKSKNIKRKRPKKKKPEAPGGKPEGMPAKKKCKRTSKIEEGYETYVETLMNKLTSLPPLRILEPTIKPNFNSVPVFGAGDMNIKENQLKGHYGSAVVPDKLDIYSYHPYTDEMPPTTTILSSTSSPYRGFYNQEFPTISKALEKNELSLAIKPALDFDNLNSSRDAGSPDTVISSSSPESCMFEPQCKWPKLVFIDKVLPEHKRNTSPVIPLIYPVPIRLCPKEWSDMDVDKDKENIPDDGMDLGLMKTKLSGIGNYSAPLKDSGNVAVTLTLTSAAAEDICGVLSALANLLKIPIPTSYEVVERTATPPSQKLGLYRRSKNSDVSIHSLLNGKPRFCRHCDIVVLSAGIRKKAADLPCIPKEEQEEEDEVIFCSTNCYMQFALTHRSTTILEEKEAAAVVDHIGETNFDESKYLKEDSLGALTIDEQDALQTLENGLKPEDMDVIGEDMLGLRPDDKFLTSSNPFDADLLNSKMEICEEEIVKRKWKSIKYKYWRADADLMAKAKKKEDSNEKPARPFYHTIKPSQMPKDERKCLFCHSTGDGDTHGAARLLNMDVNKWVHLNCALWSYEVYETVNGALMNVEVAFKRSRLLSCYACHKQGASVRCFKSRCPVIYHFPCAKKEQCAFFKDKTVLCPQHVHKGNPENKLESTAVFRRVYINREEHKQVASMIQDEKYVMRVGSLIFLNIGQLLPTQIQAFHNTNCIYPVGYKVIRMYWSMKKLGRRSQYICTINEVSGNPEFSIQIKDSDQKDFILRDKTAKGVWQKVLYPIEKMRKQAKTIKIFPDFITGDDLFGLTEPAVLRIVESLPGVDTLYDYNFRYGRSPFLELPLAINPTGCARSEPKLRTHFKRAHTLHTSSTARSFHSAFAGFYPEVSLSSPYIKQFVHSKSSQYRKMKTEWRNNVYLARSRIQGLGLYAAKDLEKHTMVIEYIGQLIRNEIAERNEAIYDAQNRGIYMFRLDENRVIDATMCGGLARYINHSCNPNCVTEAVQIDRENKIIIITNRRVTRGEELSYDYKFEVEDDKHKIPCLCGAPNCRKWMN